MPETDCALYNLCSIKTYFTEVKFVILPITNGSDVLLIVLQCRNNNLVMLTGVQTRDRNILRIRTPADSQHNDWSYHGPFILLAGKARVHTSQSTHLALIFFVPHSVASWHGLSKCSFSRGRNDSRLCSALVHVIPSFQSHWCCQLHKIYNFGEWNKQIITLTLKVPVTTIDALQHFETG